MASISHVLQVHTGLKVYRRSAMISEGVGIVRVKLVLINDVLRCVKF